MAVRRFLVAAGLVLAACGALAAESWDGSWDGTWAGGFDSPNGAQVIVAGDEAVGLYRHDNYVLGLSSSVAGDGALTLKWESGSAMLKRTGERTADAVFEEKGSSAVTVHLDRE